MSVELTSITFRSPDVTDRVHGQIMEQSMRAIAQDHRLNTMGDHFKKNAKTAPGGAYGYKARGVKYTQRKLKKFGTDVPNVRTMALMRATRNNSIVTATQHQSRLQIKAPAAWKAKSKTGRSGMNDDRRKELEAITRDEIRDATALGVGTYQKLAADPKNQRKRAKRIA